MELSGELSFIGGKLTLGTASENQKFSALLSGRYRNTNLMLNTLNENTDFNPQYSDFQSYRFDREARELIGDARGRRQLILSTLLEQVVFVVRNSPVG